MQQCPLELGSAGALGKAAGGCSAAWLAGACLAPALLAGKPHLQGRACAPTCMPCHPPPPCHRRWGASERGLAQPGAWRAEAQQQGCPPGWLLAGSAWQGALLQGLSSTGCPHGAVGGQGRLSARRKKSGEGGS